MMIRTCRGVPDSPLQSISSLPSQAAQPSTVPPGRAALISSVEAATHRRRIRERAILKGGREFGRRRAGEDGASLNANPNSITFRRHSRGVLYR